MQRTFAPTSNQIVNFGGSILAKSGGEQGSDTSFHDQRSGDVLVVQGTDLLQRMRERIMTDVVQERGGSNDRLLVFADRDQVLGFAKERQRAPREVVRAERVLESRMGGAGIDEISPTELPHVAQPLKDLGVDQPERQLVDADIVPDRVTQNLEACAPSIALVRR